MSIFRKVKGYRVIRVDTRGCEHKSRHIYQTREEAELIAQNWKLQYPDDFIEIKWEAL